MRNWFKPSERHQAECNHDRDRGRFAAAPDCLLSLFNEYQSRSGGRWRESFGMVRKGRRPQRQLARLPTA